MARLPRTGVGRWIEAAARFAARQPGLAPMLGTPSDDPELERMREGLFFLGATVADEAGRYESEGYASLADITAPELGRPFPAATIVELASPAVARVRDGAEVIARSRGDSRFRIVGKLDVGPSRIERCRIDERRRSVRFDVVSTATSPVAQSVGRRLRVYIDEPRETALLLLWHLAAYTRRVEVRSETGGTLGIPGIEVRGFEPNEAFAPEPDGVGVGASLVREYFLLPERFLLFDVLGVADAVRHVSDTRVTVILRLALPLPERIVLSPTGLRAHCAPALNLFPATAEPRMFDPGVPEIPLRVADTHDGRPYAVLRVTAMPLALELPVVDVPPVRRFGASPIPSTFPYAYALKVATGADPTDPRTLLSFASPADALPVLEPHAVSVELLATNGHTGAEVRPGDLSEAWSGMPPGVVPTNITATSPFVPPHTGPAFALRSMCRSQVPGATPLHVLQSLLYALIPSTPLDGEAGRAFRAKVRSLLALDVKVVANSTRTHRGYKATIAVDESAFQGLGDVGLFGRIIHRLLEERGSLTSFFTCEIECTKGGARLTWPLEELA